MTKKHRPVRVGDLVTCSAYARGCVYRVTHVDSGRIYLLPAICPRWGEYIAYHDEINPTATQRLRDRRARP